MPSVDPATKDADADPRKLSEHLQDGFRPAEVVPSPDGGISVRGTGSLVVLNDADWICKRGPCRHYHYLRQSFEAQEPMDGSKEWGDGTPIKRPTEEVHTCYPAPGREMDMGDVVIYECNLWDPLDPEEIEVKAREERRQRYHDRQEAAMRDELANAANALVERITFLVASHPDRVWFEISPQAWKLLDESFKLEDLAFDGKEPVIEHHLNALIGGRKVVVVVSACLNDEEMQPLETVDEERGVRDPRADEDLAPKSSRKPKRKR